VAPRPRPAGEPRVRLACNFHSFASKASTHKSLRCNELVLACHRRLEAPHLPKNEGLPRFLYQRRRQSLSDWLQVEYIG